MKNSIKFLFVIAFTLLQVHVSIGQVFTPNSLHGSVNKTDKSGATISEKKFVFGSEMAQDFFQGPWSSVGPFGGDVIDLAIDHSNPDRVFAAAGIPFKSADGGQSWTVMENLGNLASNKISAITSRPDGLMMAASIYVYAKGFKSDDSGETWNQFFIPVSRSIYSIAFDPVDNDIIYLGLSADAGPDCKIIAKTVNGGNTWTLLNLVSALPSGYTADRISIDPDDPNTIFVVATEGFSNAKVAASFDGGATWVDRTSNLPTGRPVNSISIAGGNVFIAGGQLFGSQYLGVYRSADYGQSWQNISTNFPNKYCNDIAIDPANPDRMFAATEGDGIYISTNGGTSWEFNTNGAGSNGAARKIMLHPEEQNILYAGFLSLAVCKSIDGGQTWDYANNGLATLLINDIEVSPLGNGTVIASFEAENSGGCYLSNEYGETWNLITSLPGTRFSSVAIGNNSNIFAWSNGPSSVAQEGLYKSTDGGQTWTNTGPNIGTLFETQIFSIDISDDNPDLIFIGGNNFGVNGFEAIIYKTTNGGANWNEVYKGIANNSIRFLHIVPGTEDQVILAAFKSQDEQAGFLKSDNGGSTWVKINNGIPANCKWAGSITSDQDNYLIYYGGVGGGGNVNGTIYKSTDAGNSWLSTNLNLAANSKINDIFVNPENSSVVYLASSQNGVFLSEDAAVSWLENNDGMPATNVTSFSSPFNQGDSLHVLAGTYTHSVFRSRVHDPSSTGMKNDVNEGFALNVYPNPAYADIRLEFDNRDAAPAEVSIYNLQGSLLANFGFYNLKKGKNSIHIDLSNEKIKPGLYLLRIISGESTGVCRLVIR